MGSTKRGPKNPAARDSARRLRQAWEDARDRYGLTQAGLAAEIGCSQQAIYQYLTGAIPLNLEAAVRFSHYLRVPLFELRPDLQTMQQSLSPLLAVLEDRQDEPFVLTSEERRVLLILRGLDSVDRKAIVRLIQKYSQSSEPEPGVVAT